MSADHLTPVTTAARESVQASSHLRYLAACAVASGETVSDVAAAAGTTRQTIYRWVAEHSDPAVDVVWRGTRVRVEPSGVPARIDWRAVAETLTDIPVQDAGLDGPELRDLNPGQATVLAVRCGFGIDDARTLHYRVELAAG